jgi:hypothetical protein
MREFELTYDEAFKVGLRKIDRDNRNIQVLTECYNMRLGALGLESYQPLTHPITDTLQQNWPFPQVLVGEKYRILVVRDTINLVDSVYEIEDDYSLSWIFDIDTLHYGQGTMMEMADFGEYVLMLNGVIFIYYDPTLAAFIPVTELDNIPLMRTICNFKGQAVGGNIVSDWHDCGENHVVWSRIGEMNFTPDLMNEQGFKQMPWDGQVYRVRRLKDVVMVYCSGGVMKMYPVQAPSATWGFDEMSDIGIPCESAIGGDIYGHAYVGNDSWVYTVDKEYKITKVGYKEYIDELDPTKIVVQKDANMKDYYISDGSKSFLLTATGMTEIYQSPSAVWNDSGLYGIAEDAIDQSFVAASDIFDMGYRSRKTIFGVEAGCKGDGTFYAQISYRDGINDSFADTDWVEFSPQGFAAITIAGSEFKVKVKCDSYTNVSIDYIKVRWKMTDLRNLRGVYAAPPRGQSYVS